MAIYTPEELDYEIRIYKAALTGIAAGKSMQIGDKTLTRQDIDAVRSHLQWLDHLSTAKPQPACSRTYAVNGRNR